MKDIKKITPQLVKFAPLLLILIVGIIFLYQYKQNQDRLNSFKQVLTMSWGYYKSHYIQKDGRVIDDAAPYYQSTSEGQSYAMIRAVSENDENEFRTLLNWTYANLGVRQDGLFAWRWGRRDDGTYGVLSVQNMDGSNSATDGDEQAASALIDAYNTWHDQSYLTKAKELMHSIYTYDTIVVGNRRYIVGGNWANSESKMGKVAIYTDPSYLQIANYRKFATIDTADDWNGIINSSYTILQNCTFAKQNVAHIPTDWCVLDKKTLQPMYTDPSFPPQYGYDAFRTMYNLALDNAIQSNAKDQAYLQKTAPFLFAEYQKSRLDGIYNVTNKQYQPSNSLAIMTGAISNFSVTHPDDATKIYTDILESSYNEKTGQFGNNYYDSNWAWFLTYLLETSGNNMSI